MKRHIGAVAVGLALGLSMLGGASADKPALEPGTPGEPGCHGQTMSYFAQASKVVYGKGGVGNLYKIEGEPLGLENSGDISALAAEYCATV